jgi:hypothetical protein
MFEMFKCKKHLGGNAPGNGGGYFVGSYFYLRAFGHTKSFLAGLPAGSFIFDH